MRLRARRTQSPVITSIVRRAEAPTISNLIPPQLPRPPTWIPRCSIARLTTTSWRVLTPQELPALRRTWLRYRFRRVELFAGDLPCNIQIQQAKQRTIKRGPYGPLSCDGYLQRGRRNSKRKSHLEAGKLYAVMNKLHAVWAFSAIAK